jgi:integrase
VNGKGKPASAHDLRRSFGQRLADAGVPPRDLQVVMRHASMATTEAYYLTTRVQDVAERLAVRLSCSIDPTTLQQVRPR